ncbi:MAG: hypothetical protein WCF90_06785 [Methanomicrobiales archaeon]
MFAKSLDLRMADSRSGPDAGDDGSSDGSYFSRCCDRCWWSHWSLGRASAGRHGKDYENDGDCDLHVAWESGMSIYTRRDGDGPDSIEGIVGRRSISCRLILGFDEARTRRKNP